MHKIWVADDDDAIRMVLEESLNSAGFDVTLFCDADSLIKNLKTDKPDLVILVGDTISPDDGDTEVEWAARFHALLDFLKE